MERRFIKALLLSCSVHLFILTFPKGKKGDFQERRRPVVIEVDIEKPRTAYIPPIKVMGKEKKIKRREGPPSTFSTSPSNVNEEPEEGREGGITSLHSSEEEMLRYQDIVKQKIEEVKKYPLWARREGIQGMVGVRFTVLKSGETRNIAITQSSGFTILDREAVETIKRASPFPPLPEDIPFPSIEMEVSILFSLKE